MDEPAKPVYVIDTSAWFELRGIVAVPGMWDFLKRLMTEGRIVVPHEVVLEIGRGGGTLDVWVRDQKGAHRATEDVWDMACEVAAESPDLVTLTKKKFDADAFVVATAVVERDRMQGTMFAGEVIVVSGERSKLPGKVAIPDACAKRGIRCVRLTEWFELEGVGV